MIHPIHFRAAGPASQISQLQQHQQTPIRQLCLPYNREKHAEAKQRIIDTVTEMAQATTYPLPAQCPDRFCVYRPICGIEDLIKSL